MLGILTCKMHTTYKHFLGEKSSHSDTDFTISSLHL